MEKVRKKITILMVDDDDDDDYLTRKAFDEAKILNDFYRVCDGEEMMDFLLNRGKYKDPEKAPRPGIILLDLNMPRKDGRESLQELKENSLLKNIPVVILTVSEADIDIMTAYSLGASSYIRKPVTFEQLVESVKVFGTYWWQLVELPLVK